MVICLSWWFTMLNIFFACLPFKCLFWCNVYWSLLHNFWLESLFYYGWVLRIFKTYSRYLTRYKVCKYFFPIPHQVLILYNGVFHRESFNFDDVYLPIFLLWIILLVSCIWTLCLALDPEHFLLCLFLTIL